MFLAVDIGNTTTSFGFFDGRNYLDGFKLPSNKAANNANLEKMLPANMQKLISNNGIIKRIGISSVVPEITNNYISILEKYHNVRPDLLRADKDYGFKIAYDEPGQLGTDRLANVIAVRELYGYPSIVIDLGTATKFEVIDASGDYLGGIIAPGIAIAAEALFEKGALLFPVNYAKPQGLIGNNTEDCLKSGIYYGSLGQLLWLIGSIKSQYGYKNMKIIGTGGLAGIFEAEPKLFTKVDPELTLRGLQIALDQ